MLLAEQFNLRTGEKEERRRTGLRAGVDDGAVGLGF